MRGVHSVIKKRMTFICIMGGDDIILIVLIVLLAANISRTYDGFIAPNPLNEIGVLSVRFGNGLQL